MKKHPHLILSLALGVSWLIAACASGQPTQRAGPPTVEWDAASLQLLSDPHDQAFSGYPRLAQLQNGSLLVVYFSVTTGIVGRTSTDNGLTWSEPAVILPNSATHFMDNPEVLALRDGSILVSTNMRPRAGSSNLDQSNRYAIGVIKSVDAGKTWSDLNVVYAASWKARDGCWEPKAIQLPSGDVQLYFSNEAPFTHSDEQNISMLSSHDFGTTWTTEPVTIAYRPSHRDGMSTPIVLANGTDLVVPIEDNGYGPSFSFKISIVRGSATGVWDAPVGGDSSQREYALGDSLPPSGPYAGAPYLAQMPTGETLLSFQSPSGRKRVGGADELSYAIPYVLVGDAEARNFAQMSRPFDIPEGRNGLWNSVAALANGDIIVLTSTNGFTGSGATQVWMIKGRLK